MDKEILVIEDEPQLAQLVEMHLCDAGCRVDIALTGANGLAKANKRRFDLLVLDLMLPDMDGLDVCRELRTKKDYTPILILTARSGEVDRVLGLELGADDYLTKPFSVRELVARVKAILRRVDRMAEGKPESLNTQVLVQSTGFSRSASAVRLRVTEAAWARASICTEGTRLQTSSITSCGSRSIDIRC